MKRLVIIGANDFQNQLILKAKSLGYETHVFAWEEGAVGKENADYFYPVSITEKEEILEKCKEIAPCGVCSIASDLAVITVNYVAAALGLPCNNPAFSKMQTNKYAMRRALTQAGIPCPRFFVTDSGADEAALAALRFPVIVKPTDRSGSRCITKLESREGFAEAVRAACAVSFEKRAVVEEFLGGKEYSMESISQNGIHHYLACTEKFTTGAPHFIETGHRQPSGLDGETKERVKQTVFAALTALHIENSAAHSEFKVDENGDIRIIEIGARMGGDCIGSDLVPLSTGFDFMKAVIDVATGQPLELTPPQNGEAEIQFLFTEEDIAKMHALQAERPERFYRISDIDMTHLGNITDSGTRLGYYILSGKERGA